MPGNGENGGRPLGTTDGGVEETLDGFAAGSDAADGIAIDLLEPGTTLVVETRNSVYRFVMLADRRHAVVTGGTVFREPAVVRIEGATAGGSALKMGWVIVGEQIEMLFASIRIRSSRVRSVAIESAP